jgi:predicted nuclease of predicted toxin-antitoxin system
LSLRLLIDEDAQDKVLVKILREAGHDLITVNEARLMGQPDQVVFNYALNNNRIILTFNCPDFEKLHQQTLTHSGIFVVYQEANPNKKMSFKNIARAIANLEAANIPLANQFISLNHWNY